jgi:hypothetical protein
MQQILFLIVNIVLVYSQTPHKHTNPEVLILPSPEMSPAPEYKKHPEMSHGDKTAPQVLIAPEYQGLPPQPEDCPEDHLPSEPLPAPDCNENMNVPDNSTDCEEDNGHHVWNPAPDCDENMDLPDNSTDCEDDHLDLPNNSTDCEDNNGDHQGWNPSPDCDDSNVPSPSNSSDEFLGCSEESKAAFRKLEQHGQMCKDYIDSCLSPDEASTSVPTASLYLDQISSECRIILGNNCTNETLPKICDSWRKSLLDVTGRRFNDCKWTKTAKRQVGTVYYGSTTSYDTQVNSLNVEVNANGACNIVTSIIMWALPILIGIGFFD